MTLRDGSGGESAQSPCITCCLPLCCRSALLEGDCYGHQGCWTQVLASFTFGVRFSGETIHHPGLAAPALILLVGGVAGLATNGTLCSSAEDDAGKNLISTLRWPELQTL